ncbi:hypothetical protein C4D60_Mb09t26540 [Musa balbisiana]|uniref:Peroxidase n=1 Tax=Musa balbisiana TaxID=52838 RepID=A0A4S8IJC2_MUSBA|nr:hypothetical protein C4D60_Mb09t26540 [Musa balbisiana]
MEFDPSALQAVGFVSVESRWNANRRASEALPLFKCYKGKIGDREATLIAALRTKLQQQVDRGDSVKDYKVASMFRVWYNLRKTEGKITSNMSFRGPTILVFLGFLSCVHADLKLGFYDDSCPKAEKLILDFVEEHIPNAPTVAASLLRMHFHDCFVRGCDGSVLINSTGTNQAEKAATPNQTLRGFDFIDRLKSVVEEECPGVVSCADILALATRDAVGVIGGPIWRVPTGRRDGLISNSSEALSEIPAPTSNLSSLQTSFANKGLNDADLVLLSGAHTIGVAHCESFSDRLYNFTGNGDQDPSLDGFYATNLKNNKCRDATDETTLVEMDPGSFRTFDVEYYRNLLKRRGLFESDAALTTDAAAKAAIVNLVDSPPQTFFAGFAMSMEKMGSIGVKTGSSGEIRRNCAVINS